ncbi:diguanylate cyclase [Bacillus sp. PDNC022]|uniref:GGDEF domain-containing protein n=1 Tax=Bacillus sp. PDNC022 TaxID=2812759 RepID=UPI0019636B90|nr:diguanylate cyclase [Bacillus sp. PDNC022]QRY39258.1 diguanylate cyclase [Bacillus sp. PDNC022]
MLKDLFINLTILVTFHYLFMLVFKENFLKKEDTLLRQICKGMLSGLLGVLLMFFSIKTGPAIIDLRHIPLILTAFYGGIAQTMIAAFVVIIGRLLIEANIASSINIFSMMFIATSSFLIAERHMNHVVKMLLSITIGNVMATSLFIMVVHETSFQLHFTYWIFSYIAGLFNFYVIEHQTKAYQLLNLYKFQAHYDFLTGVLNKRKFDEVLSDAFTKKLKQPIHQMSLIYLDIDYFKTINDQYGHHEGDIVLKEIGTRLIKNTRSSDYIGRIGGEEFAVFLPNCTIEKTWQIAERLRKKIADQPIYLKNGMSIHTTVSIGCAYSYGTSADIKQLPIIADQELYKAKESGRNQVSFSERKKDQLT